MHGVNANIVISYRYVYTLHFGGYDHFKLNCVKLHYVRGTLLYINYK